MTGAIARTRFKIERLRIWWCTLDPAWRYAIGAFAVARVAFTAWSLVILSIVPVTLQNLDLFGSPTLAGLDTMTGERYAYGREFEGQVLTFRTGERGFAVDTQTQTTWSLSDGRAISGPGAGRHLNPAALSVEEIFPYHGVKPDQNPILSAWERFDTYWYLAIARFGYGANPGDVHFPPLYPLLILLGGGTLAAALLISNVACVLALVLFYRMANELLGERAAARAVAMMLLFPTAFFLVSAYTEPLFILTALLALRAMDRARWLWAGIWTCLAILVRLQGVALLVPFLYTLWRARSHERAAVRLASLVLPMLAVVLYLLIRAASGDPSVVPVAETNLAARLAWPWDNYVYALRTFAAGHFALADILNFMVTTLLVAALVVGWKKLPPLLRLYCAASLIVVTMRLVDTQPLNSMNRYALSLFPMFLLLGRWTERPLVQRLVVYPSFALSLFLSAQFFLWGWVG